MQVRPSILFQLERSRHHDSCSVALGSLGKDDETEKNYMESGEAVRLASIDHGRIKNFCAAVPSAKYGVSTSDNCHTVDSLFLHVLSQIRTNIAQSAKRLVIHHTRMRIKFDVKIEASVPLGKEASGSW